MSQRNSSEGVGWTRKNEWLAFDALPPQIKAALTGAAFNISSMAALQELARLARARCPDPVAAVVREIAREEETFLLRQSAIYREKHGVPLAHVEADATIQRPGYNRPPNRATIAYRRHAARTSNLELAPAVARRVARMRRMHK